MAADNKVEIKVAADVEGTPKIDQLGKSLNTTAGSANTLGDKSAQSAAGINQANTSAAGYAATSTKLRDGLEGVSSQMASARNELLSLVGVGAGAQGLKSIVDLADSYNNLQARIKLVTGEGASFQTAFEGVSAVALRTSSSLESTGNLFAKIAEAGKQMGLGQADALKLTETINQAVQLSGASAQASDAAITQLIQGLQSGVLRGDEFNSIMEQAPRLSKTFADGLGVTTGELRKMAEQGLLTSDTIIKALQGQSDAVAAEFGKLPPTVGRAMTNLTSQFTLYVGEADKAGGYTAKLAGLIDGLASNLSTVATVMIHAGEVMGAMKLLSMAQDWLAVNAATVAHEKALVAATAGTVTNTAAKAANTAATVAQTAASTAAAAATSKAAATHDAFGMAIAKQTPALTGNAKALTEMATGLGGTAAGASNAAAKVLATQAPITALGKAAGVASSAMGLLSRTFAPLIALDIALNFKEYGTAIGEFAAKLLGAKDRTKELEAADKAAAQSAQDHTDARTRQVAALQAASDASFGLSKAAQASIAEFDKLTKAGDSSAEAIKKIGKDFDLASLPGIRDAAGVLDKLAKDGKLSATEFQDAWATALNGQDLAAFEVKAVAALAGTKREAEQTAQVLDATLREAIKRTGLDFALISGGMSKASVSALNDTDTLIKGLDRLKTMGIDTGAALTASISKGIDTADSQKAIEAVRAQIELVRKALGDKVADGLLDQATQKATSLKDALDQATPGVTSLREAMKDLGITSDQTFKETAAKSAAAYQAMKDSGTASLRELADGFKKYAQDAIAANGGVATEAIKAEAAMRGLQITTDSTGKSIVSSMEAGAKAVDGVGKATQSATKYMDVFQRAAAEALAVLEQQNAAAERSIAAQEKANDLKQRAIDLENKRRNMDREGFALNTAGERIVEQVPTARSVYEQAKAAGLTDEQALKIANTFIKNGKQTGQPAGVPGDGTLPDSWWVTVQKAIDDLVLDNAKKRADEEARTSNNSNAAASASAQTGTTSAAGNTPIYTAPVPSAGGSAKSYNVNITLGGNQTTIHTSSDADAQALIAVLQRAQLTA